MLDPKVKSSIIENRWLYSKYKKIERPCFNRKRHVPKRQTYSSYRNRCSLTSIKHSSFPFRNIIIPKAKIITPKHRSKSYLSQN